MNKIISAADVIYGSLNNSEIERCEEDRERLVQMKNENAPGLYECTMETLKKKGRGWSKYEQFSTEAIIESVLRQERCLWIGSV